MENSLPPPQTAVGTSISFRSDASKPSLERLALEFFIDFWRRKFEKSEQAVTELKTVNVKLGALSRVYSELAALDTEIADTANAATVKSVLQKTVEDGNKDVARSDRINALLHGANLDPGDKLFSTVGTFRSDSGWGATVVDGGLVAGTTTGTDIHNAVIKLDSLIQRLQTDNNFKSTQASTATQGAAGALEAVKSLIDKFGNSLQRIVGAF